MKFRLRFIAAIAVAVFLSVSAPAASAKPRDSRWDVPSSIVKIVKKLQDLFGVSTHTDAPQPPRP
jgi:hypothetical protein